MSDELKPRFEVFHPNLDAFVDPAVCFTEESAKLLVEEMDKVCTGHQWRLVVGKTQKRETYE